MPFTGEERKKACMKAMRLLEHMDRTEKGLTDRLRQAGFSDDAVQYAMDNCCISVIGIDHDIVTYSRKIRRSGCLKAEFA